ncbi:MAG: DUF507 family protein [Acidobacteria bacterium]|nr:DUF507 family protein [Acidobacteriota bacterium]
MALSREYLGYLASHLAERLEKSGKVKLHNKTAVAEKIQQVLLEDFAQEERLNQEARDYLEKYSEQIRRDAISYQEMFKLVKKELMKKHQMVPSSRPDRDGSKLSREKVIELSHRLIRDFAGMSQQIELQEEKNEVRLEIVRQFQALLLEEYRIDQGVREKIRSQKREIVEGSAEWDILFRKYYLEEMRKLGAV